MKDANGFTHGLDPSVAAMLQGGATRKEQRALPREARKKTKKAQEKQAARNGSRAVYDLDPKVIDWVKKMAEENETTASGVAEIALWYFRRALEFGEVDIERFKVPLPKNPRYGFELVWRDEA